MIDQRNAFAWSLVLAALLHALAIGQLRLPQLGASREQSRPLMLRFLSIANEPTAALEKAEPVTASPGHSRAAKRVFEPSPVQPEPVVSEGPAIAAESRAADIAEQQTVAVDGNQASRQDARVEESALSSADVVRASYEQALAAWIDRAKYYPAAVRRRGLQGGGELRVRIDRNGRVLSLSVSRALPYPILDEVARDWVYRADPFPAIPPTIKGENFEFLVPVSFRLQ